MGGTRGGSDSEYIIIYVLYVTVCVHHAYCIRYKAGSLKTNTALEYSTRVVQEGGRRCKKSTLNDLVHLSPLRIPFMNPPLEQQIDMLKFGKFLTYA